MPTGIVFVHDLFKYCWDYIKCSFRVLFTRYNIAIDLLVLGILQCFHSLRLRFCDCVLDVPILIGLFTFSFQIQFQSGFSLKIQTWFNVLNWFPYFLHFLSLPSLRCLTIVKIIFSLFVWEFPMLFLWDLYCRTCTILGEKPNFVLAFLSVLVLMHLELVWWLNIFPSFLLFIQVTVLHFRRLFVLLRIGLINRRNRISASSVYIVLSDTDSIPGLLLFNYSLILSDICSRNLESFSIQIWTDAMFQGQIKQWKAASQLADLSGLL